MKRTFLKLTTGLGLLLFFTTNSSAQITVSKGGWVLDQTVNNVDFYHKIATCDGKKMVFLKFNNKNKNAVTVSWKEFFVTQANKEKAESSSQLKQLNLSPGITTGNDCGDAQQKVLYTGPQQVSPVYDQEVIFFNFKNVKVSK